MKANVAAVALGLGMVVGSLVGGTHVGAAPQGGAGSASARHYACSCETKVTTSSLNLRSGPGTTYDVMLVMDEGEEVQAFTPPDLHQNGFVKVRYGDNLGWASEDYLADPGTDVGGVGGGEGYEIVGTGTTTDRVNFRRGPGTDYEVRDVLDHGTQIAISAVVENGFRYVWYAGIDGWIYDDYIVADRDQPLTPGDTLTTTTDLNLRESPDLNSDVVLVMPEYSEVTVVDYDGNSYFIKVDYDGTIGYAWSPYLQ